MGYLLAVFTGLFKRWGEIRPAQLLFANSLVGCRMPLLTGWRSRVNSRHGTSRLASGWQFALRSARPTPEAAKPSSKKVRTAVQISTCGVASLGFPSRPSLAPRPPRALSLIVVARSGGVFGTGRHYGTSLVGFGVVLVVGCPSGGSIDVNRRFPGPGRDAAQLQLLTFCSFANRSHNSHTCLLDPDDSGGREAEAEKIVTFEVRYQSLSLQLHHLYPQTSPGPY